MRLAVYTPSWIFIAVHTTFLLLFCTGERSYEADEKTDFEYLLNTGSKFQQKIPRVQLC